MNQLAGKEHRAAAERVRNLLSTYLNSEDLINIGAYKRGSSMEIDEAIQYHPEIISFLKQETDENISRAESIHSLIELAKTGEFNEV